MNLLLVRGIGMSARIKRILLSSAIALTLSACGGGGGSNDNSSSKKLTPDPDGAYTGGTNPALLNASNTPTFASIIAGQSSSTDFLSRDEAQNNSVLTNQSELIDKLTQTIKPASTSNSLQARSVSETTACEFGGSVSVAGEVDDSAETGILIYTFKDCEIEDNTIINGLASEEVHSRYDPESSVLSYDDLKLSQSGESFTLVGTIAYTTEYSVRADGNEETTEKQITNLASTHASSGLTSYLKDYTSMRYLSYNEEQQSVSGKIYLSTEGYATVSTSSDYSTDSHSGSIIPRQGDLYLTGASLSKGRIRNSANEQIYYTLAYRLDLDTDGDNIYELTSIQDSYSGTTSALKLNEAPVAVINIEHNSSNYNYDDHSDEHHYMLGTSFKLDADNSYDNDDSDLSFTWTIEEKPDGSTAQLEPYDQIDQLSGEIIQEKQRFIPDEKGDYKISLKATDINGSQQSSLDFINISTANLSPTLELETYHYMHDPVIIGFSFDLNLIATDEDTPEEQPEMVVSYTWIEKPEDSDAQFIKTWESIDNSQIYNDPEQKIRQTYSTKFDKEGTYKAEFTATDYNGATTSSILVVEARTTDILNSDISCAYHAEEESTCEWDNGSIKINTPTTIYFPTENGLYDTCNWQASSLAVDSAGVPEIFTSSHPMRLELNPGYLGEYTLEVECSLSYDLTTKSYFNTTFNVVN